MLIIIDIFIIKLLNILINLFIYQMYKTYLTFQTSCNGSQNTLTLFLVHIRSDKDQ